MKIVISCADSETLHNLDFDRKFLIVFPKNISHMSYGTKILMKIVFSCADPETLQNLHCVSEKYFSIILFSNLSNIYTIDILIICIQYF